MTLRPSPGESAQAPEPESDDLGRYLEDTITIDWQTPSVMERGRSLVEGVELPERRVDRLFCFVRDEIAHSFDIETEVRTCRASEVLREGTGLCYAQSHLLAALLRMAGFPTGFCYMRSRDEEQPGRFVLHGLNAVFWAPSRRWILLDASHRLTGGGGEGEGKSGAGFDPMAESLVRPPEVARGEAFLPFIHRRPAKRIVDLLERAPSLAAIRRHLPDAI